MPIYEFTQTGINRLDETTFSLVDMQERRDLQRLLRENVEVITPDTLVIAEEFGDWDDSRRRIDLLAIDRSANLVVIELKRTEDGGHMELQSIRYASMVSTITFSQAVDIFGRHLEEQGNEDLDPQARILDFLGWDEADEDQFAQEVRIVLASAEFSKEIASSVLWLIDHGIDIRCVRMKPYESTGRVFVDVQQIIPLPEAADFQFQVRKKAIKERQARTVNMDFTRFDIQFDGETQTSMAKRNAIFFICKNLCERGVTPEEISALLEWRPNLWYSVEGTVDANEFAELAAEKASSGGISFSPRRWFCDDNNLVKFNGNTYAFSKRWGGPKWHKAMSVLKEKHSQFRIDFSPTS